MSARKKKKKQTKMKTETKRTIWKNKLVVLCWWGVEPAQTSSSLFFKEAMSAGSLHRSYAMPRRRHPVALLPAFSPHLFAAIGLPPACASSMREERAGSSADHTVVGGAGVRWDGGPDGRRQSGRYSDKIK